MESSSSTKAKLKAFTTPRQLIDPGTPEAAYQAVDAIKLLWSFKSSHSANWIDAIDRLMGPPNAWELIPENKPYGDKEKGKFFENEIGVTINEFVSTIRTIVKLTPKQNDWLDRLNQESPGNLRSYERNNNTKSGIIDNNINNNTLERVSPVGTTQQSGLRRLRSEIERARTQNRKEKAKQLQQKVFAQEMSVHAALIELGVRMPTFTIPVHTERAAKAIKKRFTPAQIQELIRLLQDD